jgi:hypothetical protein
LFPKTTSVCSIILARILSNGHLNLFPKTTSVVFTLTKLIVYIDVY